ncbi:MAG: serine/threonine-protein kinase [Myxococcaceae bacterium]
MSLHSTENPIPTETFLLPGQQFCIGMPWDRGDLPRHGLPAAQPRPGPGSTLDDSRLDPDPCAGWEIGACEIIRRLSPGSARTLLALRDDPDEGPSLVVLRRIDLPEVAARDVQTQSEWAANYRHPHLARVFGCEVSDEGIFWVSELASGASLAEVTAACREHGRAVPLGLALSAVYEAALALGELHATAGFAHGLVNDQSVAVTFEGTTKLLDAGLFRCIARQASWAEVLEPMGPYLAPEQVLRGREPDAKCDVYSLAVVLHECLSGTKLRRASSFDDRVKMHQNSHFAPPSTFNVTLGSQLDEVMARALDQDRSKRYATAGEFAAALKKAASAYLWRGEQRAQFVAELFPTRKRRQQVLLDGCNAERRRRPPRPPARPEPDFDDVDLQPSAPAAPVLAIAAPRGAPAPARTRRWSTAALLAVLVAGLGALAVQYGVLPLVPGTPTTNIAEPPPPPAALPEDVSQLACGAPNAVAGSSSVVSSTEPPPETQSAAPVPLAALTGPEGSASIAAEAPAARPSASKKVKSANRKRQRSEIPVPPWLAQKPARGKHRR